ncbi:MAG TPA: hypothetical protein VFV38_30350 [Ktedonobacteraceae bacterium]|nr:hypothetical protein [Ktedonobacteraceae bacterium]
MLELGAQAALFVFWHGQIHAKQGVRGCPGFMEGLQVHVERGSEIQAEGVACDEEVRRRITVLAQDVAEMEQSRAQGCAAMHRVLIGPELFREFLTRLDAVFDRQVDEEREFLARRELHNLASMAYFWWTQQCQGDVALSILSGNPSAAQGSGRRERHPAF